MRKINDRYRRGEAVVISIPFNFDTKEWEMPYRMYVTLSRKQSRKLNSELPTKRSRRYKKRK